MSTRIGLAPGPFSQFTYMYIDIYIAPTLTYIHIDITCTCTSHFSHYMYMYQSVYRQAGLEPVLFMTSGQLSFIGDPLDDEQGK